MHFSDCDWFRSLKLEKKAVIDGFYKKYIKITHSNNMLTKLGVKENSCE
jgi:hypothetical protein